jgi:YD repeat-containing protein
VVRPARLAQDGRSLLFDPIKMRVKTETMRWAGGKLVPAGNVQDPHAEAFAGHLTENYDAFAASYPVFGELKVVALAVALAKHLAAQKVPPDWDFVRAYGVVFDTPETTPAAVNELEKRDERRVVRLRSFGGVKLTPELITQPDAAVGSLFEDARKAQVTASRAGRTTFELKRNGKVFNGTVIPLAPPRDPASFRQAVSDLAGEQLAGLPAALPGVVRYYDSTHNERTELGRSWSLLLPRLRRHSPAGPGMVQTLAVEGIGQLVAERFHLSDQFGLEHERFEKHFIHPALRRIGFQPKSPSSPYVGIFPEEQNLYRLFYRNGTQSVFDQRGRLRAVLTPDAKLLYQYDSEGRLAELRVERAGKTDTVLYEYDKHGRLVTLEHGNTAVAYQYDPQGNLSLVKSPGRTLSYRYDKRGLLREVKEDGLVMAANEYDERGRMTSHTGPGKAALQQKISVAGNEQVVETVSGGRRLRRGYDQQGRLVRVEPGDGSVTRIAYGKNRRIARVDRERPGGEREHVLYAPSGQVRELMDAAGTKTEYIYDDGGQLQRVALGGKPYATLSHSGRGRLKSIQYDGGFAEQYSYDDQGRIREYARTWPGERGTARIRLDRGSDGRVVRVTNQGGGMVSAVSWESKGTPRARAPASVAPTAKHGMLVVRGPGGGTTQWAIERDGRLNQVTEASGATTRYSYDERGRLTQVALPNGVCKGWQYGDGDAPTVFLEPWPCGG